MESILSYTTLLLLLLSYTLLLILHPSSAGTIFTEFISPNFTASNFQFIDSTGAFLTSRNGTFQASIYNPFLQSSYYLCVLHVTSNTVIWSANRDAPISSSDSMNLTPNGISISHTNGSLVWSTPTLRNSVTALRLSETGNLELLDRSNTSLWQSFDNPTDTIIIGQPLRAGMSLVSSVSDSSLSTGNYQFHVTDQDAVLRWFGQPYWKLSMDTRAFKDSNAGISYLQMNGTGLFLFSAGTGAVVVWQLSLQLSNFRFAKLDSKGHLIIYILYGNQPMSEFTAPADECQLPFSCGRLGLCTDSDGQNGLSCSCPSGFRSNTKGFGCLPSGGYELPPLACNSSSSFTYLPVGNGVHYFENNYAPPDTLGNQRSSCEDLCSKNCSCLGFFYTVSSSSCYLIKDQLGSVSSMIDSEDAEIMGYVKTVAGLSSSVPNSNDVNRSSGRNLPIYALILLPCSGAFLLIILLAMVLWWRRSRALKAAVVKLGRPNSTSSTDFDSIPGLPVRFKYEELEAATENFKTQIGSGGFGSVYKGTLADKTLVAVKKISNIGVQGKKEFCTEIAVIGNIHHVNLVRLRGFCAQGQQRLLVYEYMNRGSLDRSIFGVGPVLEWQERVDIALGTARGLAYLHGGCAHKIIHCDVKPENILLHDHQVKISDFGLSKLMSPEQSNLFTTMRGTRGYLAPEWLTNAAISDRTDVYSYGMVLLEIVSGRKNCSAQGQSPTVDEESGNQLSSSVSESAYFPLFALEMHEQGRYLELADPRLEGRVTREEVERVVRIALCCVHEDPMLRPNMANVVAMLEGGIALSEPRVESLNFLRFYGRRFTEPTMLDGNVQNGYLYRLGNSSLMSSSSGTHTSVSYLSSQQVSGPR